ncbi:hypothetical protein ACFS5L_35815 [Streptomyces phyllanthi]|uniref:hypothetical protein n=1 Tax=Streptomyces phyllanthi TaxID=1803180 RepID=UPI0031E9A57E
MPSKHAAMLAGPGRANAEGAEGRTTDTVQRVTGRQPRGFRTHVERTMRRATTTPEAARPPSAK